MYKRANISDIRRFYDDKFAVNTSFDVSNIPLWNYNINYAKYFWVYRNVKPNSKVLDFGCGSGTLAVLKSKGCKITGIDYSKKALEIARSVNNYDFIFCGSIFEFEHPERYFDYIVSLDVFGHIPFEEKDATIRELKRYLKPDGVMLHGIECGNINYDEMPEERLKRFIEIDGHVGIEDKKRTISRFKRFFNYVKGEVRFTIENSVDEYIKQAERYDNDLPQGILNYLRSLNHEEKQAFDIANGLVQLRMERLMLPSPDDCGGFLYLMASDYPISEPDFEIPEKKEANVASIIYDRGVFSRGWYDVEKDASGKPFRWGTHECLIRLTDLNKDLKLRVFSSYPEINKRHVNVFFIDNDRKDLLARVTLVSNQEEVVILKTRYLQRLDLLILTDITWKPALYKTGTDDWRTLGIGINELRFL